MKKVSNIFLKVAHILGIIVGILLLVTFVGAVVASFLPETRDALIEIFQNNGVDFGDDPESLALMAQILMIVYSFVFIILGVICIIDAIVAKKTIENPTKGRYIACIILGAMSTDFSLVAGILGLISLNKENAQKQQEE